MPFTTKSHHRTMHLPTRSRCLLLTLALVCLVGCAMTHPKKPVSHGDKFSCGEQIPKGRPR